MLILGTILSLRASGSNLFCRPNFLPSMLPKRFALRVSWDFACFLFKLRNAGAYIPKGTPCTLHVSTNLLMNPDWDFLSRTHVLWKLLSGGCHRRVITRHRHLHICAHTTNSRERALLARGPTNADKPERCMMHSRLTSRGNFLSLALRRISPCPRQLPGNSHPAQPPCATGTFASS